MKKNEYEILEILNSLGSKKLDLEILFSFYSLDLTFEIRNIIAEKIGMHEEKGFIFLKKMIYRFGLKPELINAIKLTNFKDSRDFLIENIYQNNKLNIHVIKALEPWGGDLDVKLIREIFALNEKEFSIAGLNILHFKAYKLSDEILLSLINQIQTYSNSIIKYKIITILKRRGSQKICQFLYNLALNEEFEIAKYAIVSLGSIWNENSFEQLSKLETEISNTSLLKCVHNQKLISSQFKLN